MDPLIKSQVSKGGARRAILLFVHGYGVLRSNATNYHARTNPSSNDSNPWSRPLYQAFDKISVLVWRLEIGPVLDALVIVVVREARRHRRLRHAQGQGRQRRGSHDGRSASMFRSNAVKLFQKPGENPHGAPLCDQARLLRKNRRTRNLSNGARRCEHSATPSKFFQRDYSLRHERPHFVLKYAVDRTRLSRGVLQTQQFS